VSDWYQNRVLRHLILVFASPRTLWGGPEFSEGLTDAGPDALGRYVHQRSVHPTVEAFDPDLGVPPGEAGAVGDALLEDAGKTERGETSWAHGSCCTWCAASGADLE
jgi:hypothetical protein